MDLKNIAYEYRRVNDKRFKDEDGNSLLVPWEEVCFIQFIGVPQDVARHALRKTRSTTGGMGGHGYWKPKPPPRRTRRFQDDTLPKPPRSTFGPFGSLEIVPWNPPPDSPDVEGNIM